MSSPLVKIKNLKYSYSDNSVFEMSIKSFFLEKGERLLIYGESGLGKSTFLNLISGSIESQDGYIEILGKNISNPSSLIESIKFFNRINVKT